MWGYPDQHRMAMSLAEKTARTETIKPAFSPQKWRTIRKVHKTMKVENRQATVASAK